MPGVYICAQKCIFPSDDWFAGEGQGYTARMHVCEESYRSIVARNHSNQGRIFLAERKAKPFHPGTKVQLRRAVAEQYDSCPTGLKGRPPVSALLTGRSAHFIKETKLVRSNKRAKMKEGCCPCIFGAGSDNMQPKITGHEDCCIVLAHCPVPLRLRTIGCEQLCKGNGLHSG